MGLGKKVSAHRELILALHDVGGVQFGAFTMASGLSSPIYIDLRRVTARAALLRAVAEAYATITRALTYDHLAAVPYAALPIGTAVALLTDSSLIYPRKEVKAHGGGRVVEGVYETGDTVVVLEDLVTRGGSAIKAARKLEAAGLMVEHIVVLIDRQQGGRAAVAAAGYQLHAVFDMATLLETLHNEGRVSDAQLAEVRAYLAQ